MNPEVVVGEGREAHWLTSGRAEQLHGAILAARRLAFVWECRDAAAVGLGVGSGILPSRK